MAGKLHQLYFMSSNLELSATFYTDVLDLEVRREGSQSVEFDTGAATLKIEAEFDEETLASFGLSPPQDNRGDGAITVLEVDDVDAVCERAQDASEATVLAEPRDVDWGRRICLLSDPDGYVIEVSRPLADE